MGERISIGEQYKVLTDLWTRGQQKYLYLVRLYTWLNIAWLGALVVLGQASGVPAWGPFLWAGGSGLIIMQMWAALSRVREENGYFGWALRAVEKVGIAGEDAAEKECRHCLLHNVGTDDYFINHCGQTFHLKKVPGSRCVYREDSMKDYEHIPDCLNCAATIIPLHDKFLKKANLIKTGVVADTGTSQFINSLHDMEYFFGPSYASNPFSDTLFKRKLGMKLRNVPFFRRLAYIPWFFLMLHITAFYLYYWGHLKTTKPLVTILIGS